MPRPVVTLWIVTPVALPAVGLGLFLIPQASTLLSVTPIQPVLTPDANSSPNKPDVTVEKSLPSLAEVLTPKAESSLKKPSAAVPPSITIYSSTELAFSRAKTIFSRFINGITIQETRTCTHTLIKTNSKTDTAFSRAKTTASVTRSLISRCQKNTTEPDTSATTPTTSSETSSPTPSSRTQDDVAVPNSPNQPDIKK